MSNCVLNSFTEFLHEEGIPLLNSSVRRFHSLSGHNKWIKIFIRISRSLSECSDLCSLLFFIPLWSSKNPATYISPESSLLWAKEVQLPQPPLPHPFSSLTASAGFAPVHDSDQKSSFVSANIFFFFLNLWISHVCLHFTDFSCSYTSTGLTPNFQIGFGFFSLQPG